MSRSSLTALVFLLLCFCGNCGREARMQSSELTPIAQKPVVPLTLTNERATGSFPVSAETLARKPSILEVPISRVVNLAGTQVEISVYLVRGGKNGQMEAGKIGVGIFSLYPSDRTGKFLLDSSSALHKLKETGSDTKTEDVQLVIELKRIDESKAWTPVEITIEQPNWLLK